MIKKIEEHYYFCYCNRKTIISTIDLFGEYYETMVMFEDGEELDCLRTSDLEEAKNNHKEMVRKWTDKAFEGSTAELLGVANIGQFMHTVKSC